MGKIVHLPRRPLSNDEILCLHQAATLDRCPARGFALGASTAALDLTLAFVCGVALAFLSLVVVIWVATL